MDEVTKPKVEEESEEALLQRVKDDVRVQQFLKLFGGEVRKVRSLRGESAW